MLKDLVRRTRSYRRFKQTPALTVAHLKNLVELARLSASGSNRQVLKFVLSADPQMNARIFPHLRWAGYLKDWPGPAEGERPVGYVVIVCDTTIGKNAGVDHGIAAQSMLLGATEMGFGGCMLASIDRPGLREALAISERYAILLVLALGKPAEKVQLDLLDAAGDVKYWRDSEDVHHVPKRALDDLILEC